MTNKRNAIMLCLSLLLLAFTASQANAQASAASVNGAQKEDLFASIDLTSLKSTVFTDAEHLEVRRARRTVGSVALPSRSSSLGEGYVPPPEERFIHLQGILYTASNDWVIWLNGTKHTPTALPQEALGMEVFPDYIEIKWYDDYTNQIFPIRLHPLQRFNLDTRIFLPG